MTFETPYRGLHRRFKNKDFSRHVGGGGTTSKTTQAPAQPNPPSLLPEAKPGFEDAQSYYRDILAQPPVYGGDRVAGVPESTQAGINSMINIGSGGPSVEELAGRNLNFTTTSGGSLAANPYARTYDFGANPYSSTYDVVNPNLKDFADGVYTDVTKNPFFSGATNNILNPIFERYNTEVRPGIRDRFITAGGEGGSRAMLSEEQAQRELGRSATDALAGWEAGIYEFERGLQQDAAKFDSSISEAELSRATGSYANDRNLMESELSRAGSVYALERQLQEQAAKNSSAGTMMDILRANQLIGAGTLERGFEQERIGAEQAAFEEPIYRQSAAAQSLMQAPTSAGFPGGSSTKASEDAGAMGTIQSIMQVAAMAAMIYAMS